MTFYRQLQPREQLGQTNYRLICCLILLLFKDIISFHFFLYIYLFLFIYLEGACVRMCVCVGTCKRRSQCV